MSTATKRVNKSCDTNHERTFDLCYLAMLLFCIDWTILALDSSSLSQSQSLSWDCQNCIFEIVILSLSWWHHGHACSNASLHCQEISPILLFENTTNTFLFFRRIRKIVPMILSAWEIFFCQGICSSVRNVCLLEKCLFSQLKSCLFMGPDVS